MNDDNKKGKTVTPILLGVLAAGLVFGLGIRYLMDKTMRTDDTKINVEQGIDDVNEPEDVQEEPVADLDVEDAGYQEGETAKDLPQVYEVMKGKWVLYKGGWKYPDRYIVFDGYSYEENLGEDFLRGNEVYPEEEIGLSTGKYKFEMSDDPWIGKLIFNGKLGVNFSILYEVGRPPYIEITESKYLLSRENWEEDFEDQPDFVPYTK